MWIAAAVGKCRSTRSTPTTSSPGRARWPGRRFAAATWSRSDCSSPNRSGSARRVRSVAAGAAPCSMRTSARSRGSTVTEPRIVVRRRVAPSDCAGRGALGARPIATGPTTMDGLRASDVEPELHDVAVGHHVVLALDPGLADGARRRDRAEFDQVRVGHHLGLDEPTLEVGVDHPGGLRRRPALVDGPGPGLLGAGGQERLQAEGVEPHPRELVKAGLVLAGVGEHLGGVLGLQLHELGLELGIEEDGVGRRNELAELGLHRRVGQPGVVGVEDEDERLVGQQLELAQRGRVDAVLRQAGPGVEDRAALREDLVGLPCGVQDRGVGLLAADLLLQARDGALEGLQVREHQLGVDGVDVVGRVDPADDIDTVNTELVLADLQTLERAIPRLEKEVRGKKTDAAVLDAAQKADEVLAEGSTIFDARARLTKDGVDPAALRELQLLTSKPFIFVFNTDDAGLADTAMQAQLRELVAPADAVFLDAKFESELVELEPEDAAEMLADSGQDEAGLDQLARVGFHTLGLQTFLTTGPKESRAWTIHKGWTAPQAAGVIHTDFERGFIKAEVVSYADLVELRSVAAARAVGKARIEGKDYVMADGDVVEFRFNV